MVIKQKKAWIRVVEAISAVLLITGVLLVVLNQREIEDKNPIFMKDLQISILREIQTTSALREQVFYQTYPSPGGEDLGSLINATIKKRLMSEISCGGKICEINDACIPNTEIQKDVYVESAFFSVDSISYKPRKLNLFCWIEE